MGRPVDRIEELLFWQQVAYGAAMVGRMAQNYSLFCEVAHQGDAKVFHNILQLVWEFASGQNTSIDFLRQQDKLEAVVPDAEQFDGFGVWPAMDATTALFALLSACDSSDVDEILSIATLSRSTIEHYLQAVEEGGEFDKHPLVLADREFSEEVIEVLLKLQSEGKSRKDCVMAVKVVVEGLEVSNIGVSASE